MRSASRWLMLAATALSLHTTRARAETKARALTALDDARACAPTADGGLAVATGGGLALLSKDALVGTAAPMTLTSIDGLPDTRVLTVTETTDGLWVGTEGGAALVSPGHTVVRTVGATAVHAIHPSTGGVYFGTWGNGLLRLAEKNATPITVPSTVPGRRIAGIAEHVGVMHVAYADGPLARLDGGSLRAIPNSPTHGQALASVGGRLLLGDLEGLYRVDGGIAPLASVDVRGIAASGEKLLVATYGSGLLSSSTRGGALLPDARPSRWTRGVAASTTLRCAATADGLFVDEGSGWRKVPLGGPPSNDVTALGVSGERVAVGTFDHGAALFADGKFRPVAGLAADETINTVAWQGEGSTARLWLGTAHGLVSVDTGGAVTKRVGIADGLPSSIVRSIIALPSDRLLVGTEEGPAGVDGERITPLDPPKKGRARSLESPAHATWALAASPDGTLFIGTSTGLYWGKDGRFQRASVSTGDLKDDWVTAIAVHGNDVFVGTYSAGVTRLTFDGSAARPRATHLGGGYVNPDGLTLRGTDLLASTMDGLLVRSVASDVAAWQTRLDASTGRDVTAARVVGTALWVASRRGIAITAAR